MTAEVVGLPHQIGVLTGQRHRHRPAGLGAARVAGGVPADQQDPMVGGIAEAGSIAGGRRLDHGRAEQIEQVGHLGRVGKLPVLQPGFGSAGTAQVDADRPERRPIGGPADQLRADLRAGRPDGDRVQCGRQVAG
jgi:hypothetical protein